VLETYTTRQSSASSAERPAVSRPADGGFVAVLVIDSHFPDVGSLKCKRKELSSIKAQVPDVPGRRGVGEPGNQGLLAARDADRSPHRRFAAPAGRCCRRRSSAGVLARCPEGARVERLVAFVEDLRG